MPDSAAEAIGRVLVVLAAVFMFVVCVCDVGSVLFGGEPIIVLPHIYAPDEAAVRRFRAFEAVGIVLTVFVVREGLPRDAPRLGPRPRRR